MRTIIKIQDKLQTVQTLLGKIQGMRQLKNIILKQFIQQFLNDLKTSDTRKSCSMGLGVSFVY
jgi:cytolysin (calcineurin-like family phosphatase)